MTDDPLPALTSDVKASWQRFLDVFEPLRPELYRYCRYLTHSAWDAEDLAQDTLARAMVTLGTRFRPLPNPRAWLFRVASNLWIDRMRRDQRGARIAAETGRATEPAAIDARATREAAGTLLVQLAPQERAAVVLKDVFDLSLDEIALALGTTVGAVKAALHRGRGKLEEPDRDAMRAPATGVLEAFCAAFNAGDMAALTALLLDNASVEIVGMVTEYGGDEAADPTAGSFAGMLGPITNDARGGVEPALLEGYLGAPPRATVELYRGEPIVAFWYTHTDGDAIRAVATLETDGTSIARVRNYFFSPDVIAEVARELAQPFRTNGYRYWLRA